MVKTGESISFFQADNMILMFDHWMEGGEAQQTLKGSGCSAPASGSSGT